MNPQDPYGQPQQKPYDPYGNVAPYAQPKKDNAWLWAVLGVGCGGMLLLALCGGGMLYWGYRRAQEHGTDIFADVRRQVEEARDRRNQRTQSPDDDVIPNGGRHTGPAPNVPDVTSLPADRTLTITARVTEYSGTQNPISVGAECAFNVSRVPRSDGTFWCNAQVVCGGQQIYGGATAGFFPCTWYDPPNAGVVGEDSQTSAQDRDGAFEINTVSHTLAVSDDSQGTHGVFHMRAEITGVTEESTRTKQQP